MEHAQLALIVGFAVALALQALKRVWPGLDVSEALVKQVTAAVLAGIGLLAAHGWQVTPELGWQIVGAIIVAITAHKTLLKTEDDKARRLRRRAPPLDRAV